METALTSCLPTNHSGSIVLPKDIMPFVHHAALCIQIYYSAVNSSELSMCALLQFALR